MAQAHAILVGIDETQDPELGTFYLGRAARQGNTEAMFRLGRLIESGRGPVRDAAQAHRWYRKAAAGGHMEAAQAIAELPPEPQGQLDLAIEGDARSQYQTGFAHMMGTGAPRDYCQSYFWFKVLEKTMPAQASMQLQMLRQRLDEGTCAALDELAGMWSPGNLPPESPRVVELRASATADDAEACCVLGHVLGQGSPDAQAEAMEWFSWSASQGFAPAHYKLAFQYRRLGDAEEMERHLELGSSAPAPTVFLEEGAALGINACRYLLAARLIQEPARPEDPQRAISLYRAAVDEGYVPAMTGLAACYFHGNGVERDPAQAEHWFAEAAKSEDADALFGLGVIYRNAGLRAARGGEAEGAGKAHAEATDYFERAARKGHVEATYQLSLAYRYGEGVERNRLKARELTGLAAERGHAESQYQLANNYARGDGEGFPKDDTQAAYWYERAADQQHPAGTYRWGVHLMYGRGVERDFEKGWELVETAAKMDDLDAMVMLAAMIDTGEAPIQDPDVALEWYQKAADGGNAEAQFRLGQRLADTEGPDYGRPYLEKAAAQGHQEAKERLETLVQAQAAQKKRLEQEQAKWSNDPVSMAVSGDANAQFQLAFAHFSGMGVPRSMPLAYFWMKVVERSMPAAVGQMLQAVAAQLPPAKRAELDGLAGAWTPGTAPPAEG